MLLYVLLVAVFLNTHTEATLRCLYCTDAVSPTDCDTVLKCGSHERCYVDAFVSATGSIRYNLGCRDENQCTRSSGLGKREVSYKPAEEIDVDLHTDEEVSYKINKTVSNSMSRLHPGTHDVSRKRSNGLLVCSECCSGNLCSNKGCGNTGYISPRGPICFNCATQLTPDDCSKIKLCGRDEVCMLFKTINPNSHEVRYTTKCEAEKRCNDEILKYKGLASLFIGKRRRNSFEIGGSCLVQCCTTDICNLNCDNGTSLNSTGTPGPTTATSQVSTSSRTSQNTMTTTSTSIVPVSQTYTTSTTMQQLTPTQGSITYGCYYRYTLYAEGEHWNDGCEYTCTCVDGKTGFYSCKQRCLTWKLPSICRLRPPTIGKCCPEPDCPSNYVIKTPPGYVPT